MEKVFALRGNIVYCTEPSELIVRDGAYLVCNAGRSAGVFVQLPENTRTFRFWTMATGSLFPA